MGVIEYLEWIGESMGTGYHDNFKEFSGRRKNLHAAMQAIQEYEQILSERLISGLQMIPDVEIAGISNKKDLSRRVPTVSFTAKNENPQTIAQKLADENIFVWHGHNYALEAIRLMGIEDSGGVIRIGPVHYNTIQEIDRNLDVLGTCL